MPTRKNGRMFGGNFRGLSAKDIENSESLLIVDPQTKAIRAVVRPHKQQIGLKSDDKRYMGDNAAVTNYGTQNNNADQRQQNDTSLVWTNIEAAVEGTSKKLIEARGFRDNNGAIEFKATDADAAWTPFSTIKGGDITGVAVAGTGLSGGGAAGDVTITITPDTVAGAFSAGAVANASVNGLATVATSGLYADLSSIPTTFAPIIGTDADEALAGNTTIPTNNNELTNGAGYTTSAGTCTSVGLTAGSLIDVSGSPITASGTITVDVDLSELTDGTGAIDGTQDEMVYLDDGSQKRKQINEINLGQFNNDQSWTSNAGTVTATSTDTFTNKTFAANGAGNSVTNIPNASLDNSTISGKSLGSNLSTLTLGTGFGVGTTYDGQEDLTANINFGGSNAGTFTNCDVVVDSDGRITSVTNGTGGVAAQVLTSETELLPQDQANAIIKFPTAAQVNTNVASYNDGTGVFTIAATGTYQVTANAVLIGADGSRDTVAIQLEWIDGATTHTTIVSGTIPTLTQVSAIKLEIPLCFITFTDATTRTLSIKLHGNTGLGNVGPINSSNKQGFPYGGISITRTG